MKIPIPAFLPIVYYPLGMYREGIFGLIFDSLNDRG